MANVKIRGLPTFSDDFTNESTDFLVITESGTETSNAARTSKISINKLKKYIEIEDLDGNTKFSVHTGDNTASITCDGLTPAIVNKSGININPLNLSAPINYGLGIFTSDGLKLPAGSSAQRPFPTNGLIRYNTELGQFEGYVNNAWAPFSNSTATVSGPDYSIQYKSGSAFTGSSNLIYSEEQLSGVSGFFHDFRVTGDLAVGGNLYVTGEMFVQSVTDISVTGDISGYNFKGTSGVFDTTTGQIGGFSQELTISGTSVLTGIETGNFVTTGETGVFVTTGQTGDFVTTAQTGGFVTTGLTGDFVTTGETGVFVTTGQTGDFVTTGLTGNFVTTGETGVFVTTGQTGDFATIDLLTGISDADNDTYITTEESPDLDSICFYTSGSKSVEIDASGDLLCYNDVVAYYSASDQRLKENIQIIDSPINKIEQINGISFDWKEEMQPKYSGKDYGVLAQEVELVLPEAVKDKENGFKSVKYNSIIPLLIECIKDQEKRIKELEKICQSKA